MYAVILLKHFFSVKTPIALYVGGLHSYAFGSIISNFMLLISLFTLKGVFNLGKEHSSFVKIMYSLL
jgi:hypothetical protein